MPSWSHLLIHSVTVEERNGVSSFGDPAFGSKAVVKCRVEHKRQVLIGRAGTDRVTTHVIMSEVEIPIDSKVWLPGADTADDNAAEIVVDSRIAPLGDGSATLYEAKL